MDEYLQELIERMLRNDDSSMSSKESVSFSAYREAEKLTNKDYLSQLKVFIENNPQKNKRTFRDKAYFIMGKLLINNPDINYIEFLIHRLLIETDKYIISSVLDRLADISFLEEINIEPIVQYTKNEKWLIRNSAIRALQSSNSKMARQTAIGFLKSEDIKRDRYEITYANATLSRIGRIEDIVFIQPLTEVRLLDIRDSAKFAIEAIEKRGL